jgi:Ca2+-binding RTX toxin-like protein
MGKDIQMAIKHGTAGADTLIGTSVADHLFGEAGNDVLKGLAGADTLDGGGDTDTATYAGSAQAVTVRLDGGSGAGGDAAGDTYVSIENVVGSSGADTLVGNALGNRLDGGLGADIFTGGAGNDTINAGDGLDLLAGGIGADVLNGGGFFDTADYRTSVTGVNVNLTTGATGGDEAGGDTFVSIEHLIGSEASDLFVGTSGFNVLAGAAGNDKLFGSSGDDVLDGGFGADTLVGGNDADTFTFTDTKLSPTGFFTRDVITDFGRGLGDIIDLHNIDANPADAVNDSFEFLGKDALVDAPGQISYTFENNTTVVRINTEGGFASAPEMEIQLSGQINLVAGDFIIL